MAEECFAPVLSFGVYTREKTNYYGALSISYIYRFNRKISLGVTGGITGNKGTASSLYEALDENTKDNRRYLYVLPTFRWHWFTRPKFSLYTSAGLGAYFLRNSFGGEVFHKTKFAYQFSFLGIEYGSRFAFFTEFGVRIYRNNRSRRPLSFLTYERYRQCQYTDAHTLHFLERIGTSRSVAPVVNTSSIISTCFLAKASARRRQKIPSTFSHRS